MSRSRWRRRLAIASAVLVATILVLAAAAWVWRDQPRRRVEAALAERLGAEVGLGAFVVEGTQRFVLRDLVVTRMMGRNRLRRLSVGTLAVEGSATDLLAGRFALLDASTVEIRLGAPDPSIPEPTEPAAEVVVERFRLSGARAILEGGGATGEAAIEADLTGIGGDLAGTVRASSDRLEFAGGGASGEVRGGAATAEFAKGSSGIVARASAAEALVAREGRSLTIPHPEIAGELTPLDDGKRLGFTARATVAGIDEIALRGTFDQEAGRLRDADGAIRGVAIAAWLPLVPGLPEGSEVAGRLDATAVLVPGERLRWSAHAAIDVVDVPTGTGGSQRVRAERADLVVEGTLDAADPAAGGPIRAQLRAPSVHGAVAGFAIPAGLVPIEATFEGEASAGVSPAVSGRLTLANGRTGKLTAEVTAEDLTNAPALAARWRLEPTALRDLVPLALAAGVTFPDGLEFDGTLRAEGETAWPATRGAMLRARVNVDALAVAVADAARLDRASLAATMTWPNAEAPIDLGAFRLEGEIDAPPVPKAPLLVAGRATVEPAGPAIRGGSIDIESEGLFKATATGGWAPASGGTFAVTLAGVDLQRWQKFLRPWIGDPAPGFAANGTMTADLSGEITRDLAWTGRGKAAIAKSGFTSEDGARVLDGLGTSWEIALSGRGLASGSARASAKVEGFQILWDSFFADYAALPSTLDVEGSFDASDPGGVAWAGKLAWRYPDGPALDVAAAGKGHAPTTYEAEVAVADLEKTLATYLRVPLGDVVPWFTRIEGGGALDVRARGSIGSDAITLAGRVHVEDARIEGTKGFVEVDGLDLDLPYDLRWGAPDAQGRRPLAGPPLAGSLGFRKLEVGGMAVAETATPLRIEADTIGLDEGLALPLLGGVLGFEKLTLIEALRPTRRAETAILIWDLQMKQLAEAFGLPPLDGTADGYFPAVTLQGSSFEVKGGGEISLFGGKVKIGGISGQDVLTRFPKLRMTADFDAIDLKKVTDTFDFGEMTGIVRGYVHDLELFRGVPTRFDARLETVPTKGMRNKINVKAVNNIVIIGTGSGGILDRGLHKFIDEFTYDRLGIELKLANDVFLMRGLERRGDQELFVKGRLPFPINVINAQPGRTVSFRSMMERLSAVDFAGATTRR